jgi:hypothetical protein
MKKALIASIAAAAVALGSAGPARAGGAEVIIERGNGGCGVDPGDIPGVDQGFLLANDTIVVTPAGFVNVTCTGWLPDGVTLEHTYASTVMCFGDGPPTQGRITATVSGRVTVVCPQTN